MAMQAQEPVGRGRLQSGHPRAGWRAKKRQAEQPSTPEEGGDATRMDTEEARFRQEACLPALSGDGFLVLAGTEEQERAGARDGSARWPLGDDAFSGVKLRAATLLVFNLSN